MKVVNDWCGYCGNYLGPIYSHEQKQLVDGKSAGNIYWGVECLTCRNKPDVNIDGQVVGLVGATEGTVRPEKIIGGKYVDMNKIADGEIGVPTVGEIPNVHWDDRPRHVAIGRTRYRKSMTGSYGEKTFLDFFEPGCEYTITRNKMVNGTEVIENITHRVVMAATTRLVGEAQRSKRCAYLCPSCHEEQSPQLFTETRSGKCQVCGIEFRRVIKRYRHFPWTLLNLFGRR